MIAVVTHPFWALQADRIILSYLQELPEHHRGDAVSSMVYEANARAEVVHLRVRQTTSFSHHGFGPGSPSNSGSPSTRLMGSQDKSIFDMDMVVDQGSLGESMWSC
ncbi:hypothetical protein V6N12_071320 [Hibiscus sabdariffa]|uniref:Uncharacterized protein n=1 Tax=Hibiscus sabdariffa TaxID=183260 RepID=A0ABR2FJR6_9ROSI